MAPQPRTQVQTQSQVAQPLRAADKPLFNAYDLENHRAEYIFKPPQPVRDLLLSMIVDPRDEVMLYTLWSILVVMAPSLFLLFRLPVWFPALAPYHHAIGLAYMVLNFGLFIKPFNYLQHYTAHRRLFKNQTLNTIIPYVYAPLFGVPCGMYHIHHILMHHCENNSMPDLSSTLPYQRDSFWHFCLYWWRFTFGIWVQLPMYCMTRKNATVFRRCVMWMALYLLMVFAVYKSNPVAATWGLIMPYMFTTWALMWGNWAQHIFVDPSRPHSNFGLTYNCINGAHNSVSFNDGYHIGHHVNASTHWSTLPQTFTDNIDKYIAEDAIVFEKIDYFMIAFYSFLGMTRFLAKHYVNIGPVKRTEDEVVALLKSRYAPIFDLTQVAKAGDTCE